jgi:hypothetical protein
MSTPYERGKQDGHWTLVRLRASGFRSIQACLERAEREYQQELALAAVIRQKNPVQAKEHTEYMQGRITATRASLRALLQGQG